MHRIAVGGIAVAVAAAACGGGELLTTASTADHDRPVAYVAHSHEIGHYRTQLALTQSAGEAQERKLVAIERATFPLRWRRVVEHVQEAKAVELWFAEVERQEEERRQREAEERRQREAEERRQREAAQESDVAASAPAAPQPEPASQPQPDPAPPAPSGSVWDQLAQCESGGNWHINTGNGYYGGLQFALSTWHSVGGTGYPHEHSREEQIRRGQILQQRAGWGQWPACAAKLGLL
jgi:resuscitation-promoting factor RpfB